MPAAISPETDEVAVDGHARSESLDEGASPTVGPEVVKIESSIASPEWSTPGEVDALRAYALRPAVIDSHLGLALWSYADRIERVARGDLPSGAARDLSPVTPGMIGAALTSVSALSRFELIRNVLIFLPVLWTWYEVSKAAYAYGQIEPARRALPFIALWQEGLGDAYSLSTTASVAVGLLAALVAVSVVVSVQRGRVERKRDHITADIASLISRASAVQSPLSTETPTAQIEAFIAAGRGLVSALGDVAERLRRSAEPLAESVASANQILRMQSEQMQRQIAAIERIAPSLERLGTAAPAFENAATILRTIEGSLTPSAGSLVKAVEHLADYSDKLGRATDDFTAGLASVNSGTEQFAAATRTMNEVANRLMDGLNRR